MSAAAENVIGGILLGGKDAYWQVADILRPEDFADHRLAGLYRLCGEVAKSADPDAIVIGEEAERLGLMSAAEVIKLAANTASTANIRGWAERVADAALDRRFREICARGARTGDRATTMAEISALLNAQPASAVHASVALTRMWAEVMARYEAGEALMGLQTGFPLLDEMTGGLQPGRVYGIGARAKMGKEQPNSALVLTPLGFKAMGDVRVGDALASIDGAESYVSGVYPQGVKDVYEVTFSDGRKVRAGLDHLWVVCHHRFPSGKVMKTSEIIAELAKPCMRRRLWVPLMTGEYGRPWREEIDPWLLGFILGDGATGYSSVMFTTADAEILERVSEVIPAGVTIKEAGGYDYRLSSARGVANPVMDALRRLGVMGCRAWEKRVPTVVFDSDRETRLSVLQGLMDSDGWAEKKGACRIAVSNEGLASDIQRLVFSLGGSASIRRRKTTGRDSFAVAVRLADRESIFRLSRKKDRCTGRQRLPRLTIASIEKVGAEESTCIMVTHPSRTYITDNYVVTHNTVLAMNICGNVACPPVGPDGPLWPARSVAVWSLEMTQEELMQRMVCARSGVPSVMLQRPRLMDSAENETAKLTIAIKDLRSAPLLISDRTDVTVEQIEAQARQLHAMGQLDLLCIDYLGLLRLPKADRHDLAIAHATRRIKIIAKELRIPVILVFQLNRGSEQGSTVRPPRPSDARDSGAIEQDLDAMLLLHRPSYYDKNAPKGLRLDLAIQRNGPTGLIRMEDELHACRFTGGVSEWIENKATFGDDDL